MKYIRHYLGTLGVGRSGFASLQVGLAVLGALAILWGLAGIALFGVPRAGSSGFAEGLAVLFFGLHVLGGFVLVSAGLLIPQQEGEGIRFTRRQRVLLGYGVLAPVAAILAVPVGVRVLPPVTEPLTSILVAVLVVVLVSGPLATLLAVGWKLRSQSVRSPDDGS